MRAACLSCSADLLPGCEKLAHTLACSGFVNHPPGCEELVQVDDVNDLSPECRAGMSPPSWQDVVVGVGSVICGPPASP